MGQNKQEFKADVNETLDKYGKATFVNAKEVDLSPIIRTASELGADYSYVLRENGQSYRVTITRD